MLPDIQSVPLCQIDREDSYFQITTQCDMDALAASIERFGLIHPPILIPIKSMFRIVSGFYRVGAVAILGWTTIPGLILPEKTPLHICVQLAIVDNCSHRSLNLVEQGRCLNLLSAVPEERPPMVEAANAMGLDLNQKMAEKLFIVNQMGPQLKEGLIKKSISLPVALQIHALKNPQAADALCNFLIEFNLSLTRQREFIDWIDAISRRDELSIVEILKEAPIVDLRNHQQIDMRQKANKIRKYLKKRRYPNIVKAEARYELYRRQVGLPDGIELIPPPYFEGDTYSLKITFKTCDDLKTLQNDIKYLFNSPALENLIKAG